MPITYISQLVVEAKKIPWNGFLPSTFPQSMHDSLRNWSVHPRDLFPQTSQWVAIQDSMFPWIEFYLEPSRAGIQRVLEFYSVAGKIIGQWASCSVRVRFAADPAEKWDFDHSISIARTRFRINEPSLCWFSFGRHMWDHANAHAQADFWNQWAKQFAVPVEFFVSENTLIRRFTEIDSLQKLAQRGVAMEEKIGMGIGGAAEHPQLKKWFEAFWDILDTRCEEVRKVTIELRYHELQPGMTRETAMQRLLAEALPHISGTIWNNWAINGFITKLEGLETLRAYSGPDDQHTVELGKMTIKKGGQADLFLLVERAGFRLAIESKKLLPPEILDQLEHDSGFTFYQTPARERPAPTSYTLREKHFLPPEGVTDDPGPEAPFDLQKWTKEFHRSQKTTQPKPSARSAKK